MELSDVTLSGNHHRRRVEIVSEEDRETLFGVHNA